MSPRRDALPSLHLLRLRLDNSLAVVAYIAARRRVEEAKIAVGLDAVPAGVGRRGGEGLEGERCWGCEGDGVAGLFIHDEEGGVGPGDVTVERVRVWRGHCGDGDEDGI